MLSGTRAAAEKKARSVDIEIGGMGADISSKVMQGNSEVKFGHGGRYLVQSTWYQVPGTKYLVPGR